MNEHRLDGLLGRLLSIEAQVFQVNVWSHLAGPCRVLSGWTTRPTRDTGRCRAGQPDLLGTRARVGLDSPTYSGHGPVSGWTARPTRDTGPCRAGQPDLLEVDLSCRCHR